MKSCYILITLLQFCSAGIFETPNQVVRIDKFEICDSAPNNPFQYHFELTRIQHKTVINGYLDMLANVSRVSSLTTVYRCANKDNLDSCQFFGNMTSKDNCVFFIEKNAIASDYFNSFKPPYKCPFHKGRYVLTNGGLNPNIPGFMPLGSFFWKSRAMISDYYTKEYYYTHCVWAQMVAG